MTIGHPIADRRALLTTRSRCVHRFSRCRTGARARAGRGTARGTARILPPRSAFLLPRRGVTIVSLRFGTRDVHAMAFAAKLGLLANRRTRTRLPPGPLFGSRVARLAYVLPPQLVGSIKRCSLSRAAASRSPRVLRDLSSRLVRHGGRYAFARTLDVAEAAGPRAGHFLPSPLDDRCLL